MPFGATSAGLLAGSATTERTLTETMLLLAPQFSMSEAYTFDTPSGVKTGMDAVRLFTSSAAKGGLILFCNLNPKAEVGCMGSCN